MHINTYTEQGEIRYDQVTVQLQFCITCSNLLLSPHQAQSYFVLTQSWSQTFLFINERYSTQTLSSEAKGQVVKWSNIAASEKDNTFKNFLLVRFFPLSPQPIPHFSTLSSSSQKETA